MRVLLNSICNQLHVVTVRTTTVVMATTFALVFAGCDHSESFTTYDNLLCPTSNFVRIETNPESLTVDEGATAEFSVTASGVQPFRYSWSAVYSDGNTVEFASDNGPLLRVAPATLAYDGNKYRVTVRNDCPSASTSDYATLTVVASPPRIDTPPSSASVNDGQTATFAVTASGSRPLTYQWQRNSVDIAGATAATFVTPATSMADNGAQYAVVVTNARGTTTSAAATLTVLPIAPTVTAQPQGVAVVAGQPAGFSVTATGSAPLSYQWQRSNDQGATFAPITGATSASYNLAATALADNGARFRVVVNNGGGSATSDSATLTVTPAPMPPSITTQPQDLTLDAGQPASFAVTATGSTPLAYQWQRSNDGGVSYANIAGATVATYAIAAVGGGDNGARFRVVVSNSVGSVTSAAAVLTVNTFVAPPGARIAGASNTIVRKADGTVWVWGSIPGATFGVPVQQLTPVQVAGLSDIRAVAAGGSFQYPFFYALHRDGSVFAWGSNQYGELGVATPLHRQSPQAIAGLTRVIAIAAAEFTGYALRDDGTVWSWGANDQGELGSGSVAQSQSTPQQIPGLTNIVSISAFSSLALAVRNDGALFGWGQGSNLTTPNLVWPAVGGVRPIATQITEINGVLNAFAGNTAVFTLMSVDRSLRAWGVDINGVLGLGTVTINTGTPTESGPTLKPWTAVRACHQHAVGWTAASLPYAWGQNTLGQLGDPSITPRTATANLVPGLGPVLEMACGYESHSMAVKVNGEVWTWGQNNRGQLGDGTTTTRTSPVQVPGMNLN